MSAARWGSPWTGRQRRLVLGLELVALAGIAIAWLGTARATSFDDQLLWIDLAVVGVVVGLSGDAAVVFFGRRSIGRRRSALLADALAAPPRDATTDGWSWIPGTARAHRGACPLTAGKRPVSVDPVLIRREGLTRCEVCG